MNKNLKNYLKNFEKENKELGSVRIQDAINIHREEKFNFRNFEHINLLMAARKSIDEKIYVNDKSTQENIKYLNKYIRPILSN